MRDEHLDRFHLEYEPQFLSSSAKFGCGEAEAVLLDLVTTNNVDAVKMVQLQSEFTSLAGTRKIFEAAAYYASPAMLDVLSQTYPEVVDVRLVTSAIEGQNTETLQWLYTKLPGIYYSEHVRKVLISDSVET